MEVMGCRSLWFVIQDFHTPDPRAKAQLDLLSKLIGSSNSKKGSVTEFKLNLFNTDEEEEYVFIIWITYLKHHLSNNISPDEIRYILTNNRLKSGIIHKIAEQYGAQFICYMVHALSSEIMHVQIWPLKLYRNLLHTSCIFIVWQLKTDT